MKIMGDFVSGFGILLFLIGYGYWHWFLFHTSRYTVIRWKCLWHLLGNLTVVGLLAFVLGRALVESAQRHH